MNRANYIIMMHYIKSLGNLIKVMQMLGKGEKPIQIEAFDGFTLHSYTHFVEPKNSEPMFVTLSF